MAPAHPNLQVRGTKSVGAGRSLHATRAFAAGDLLALLSDPLICLPAGPDALTTCAQCLRHSLRDPDSVSLRACTACRSVAYCGPACQRANWRLTHSKECKPLQRARGSSSSAASAAGAGALLPLPVRALVQVLVREDLLRAFDELEGHVARFRATSDAASWDGLQMQAQAGLHFAGVEAAKRAGSSLDAAVERAVGILCKLLTNGFSRDDAQLADSGLLVDGTLAMANHSCMPNAEVLVSGRRVHLRAKVPIAADEEVFISYQGA